MKRLSDFENFSLCQNVSVVVEEKFKALVMKQSKEINEKMELEKKYKAKVDSILNSNKNKLSPSNAELFRKEMDKKIYQILKMSNVDLEKLEEAVKTFEVKVYSGFSTIKEFDIEGSKYKVILKVKKDKNYLTINGRPIISDVPFDNLNSKEAMEYMIAYHNKNKEKSVIRNA